MILKTKTPKINLTITKSKTNKMATKNRPDTFVKTGIGRLGFAHLHEPQDGLDGKEPNYNTKFYISKKDTAGIAAVRKGIDAAIQLGVEKKMWKSVEVTKKMKDFSYPLYDGDEYNEQREMEGKKPDPACSGCMFLNAKSTTQPGLVKKLPGEKKAKTIENKTDVYSGANAMISVNFGPFNNKSVGIGCYLNNVCVTGGGEPLGGGNTDPFDDFNEDDEFTDEDEKTGDETQDLDDDPEA